MSHQRLTKPFAFKRARSPQRSVVLDLGILVKQQKQDDIAEASLRMLVGVVHFRRSLRGRGNCWNAESRGRGDEDELLVKVDECLRPAEVS